LLIVPVQWESYTLGVAPFNPNEAELIAFEDLAAANKLEYARGAGQRYLIQRCAGKIINRATNNLCRNRWDDGTLCDKTGQKRKIEVQVRWTALLSFKFALLMSSYSSTAL
jgi:protein OS-9